MVRHLILTLLVIVLGIGSSYGQALPQKRADMQTAYVHFLTTVRLEVK